MKATNSRWFIFPNSALQAKLRLFCFPYAGGGASAFRSWPDHLPDQVGVCAVQLPGRENRLTDPPFTRLEPLVRDLVEVLPPYLDLPFALFGYSLGAAIAFELARQLCQKHGLTPLSLFVSARVAPHLPDPESPPVHRLSDAALIDRLRRYNATPEHILQNDELMGLILPTLRADFEINETYICTPGEPLSCPIYTFTGSKDETLTHSQVAAWREQTSDLFVLRTLPDGHFFIHDTRELFLQILANDLQQLLHRLG
jgi:medium-chain acyl-[acyl-carrier-protein] hydrolase